MTPEEKARQLINARLEQSDRVSLDLSHVNPKASSGVAVREYPPAPGRLIMLSSSTGSPWV